MSFIEDLGKKVTQAGNDTTQAAKNFSDINKFNSEIKACEKNIAKIYSEMGQKYYEIYSESPVEEMKAFVDEIRANKSRIDELGIQIAGIKGLAICESCGAEIPVDSQFCPNCGMKMEKKEPEIPEGMKKCPSCGLVVGISSKFCVKCGANLSE